MGNTSKQDFIEAWTEILQGSSNFVECMLAHPEFLKIREIEIDEGSEEWKFYNNLFKKDCGRDAAVAEKLEKFAEYKLFLEMHDALISPDSCDGIDIDTPVLQSEECLDWFLQKDLLFIDDVFSNS
jgi:hypothetical protein